MKRVTAICMEEYPGYPDPIIMTVDVADDATDKQIEDAVIQERMSDLEGASEQDIRDTLRVCFAFEGDITYQDMIFDWRT